MNGSALLIVDLFPSLLQPEGDRGNAVVLAHRARRYGVDATSVVVHPGDDAPPGDIFVIGGSADLDLSACAERLRSSGVLRDAVERGAVVFGVGAGFALLARSFVDPSGLVCLGAGVLDVVIEPGELASGPVVTRPSTTFALPAMSGYELHTGRAVRAAGVNPLVDLEIGVGDGPAGAATDGAVSGKVIGTWLHGPVLPRNRALADLLLGWAAPRLAPVELAEDSLADAIGAKRIAEARPKG
jgi:CobQ-like glutamine amidotransferase family enzyme